MHIKKSNPFNYKMVSDDIFNKSIADFLGTDFTVNQPSANIVEHSDRFVIEFAAPGLQKEDFNIKLDKNNLIISANVAREEKKEGEHFKRREFNFSSFKRSFLLPKEANKDEISANYSNGILNISLLKKEEEKEKEPVEIKVT